MTAPVMVQKREENEKGFGTKILISLMGAGANPSKPKSRIFLAFGYGYRLEIWSLEW